MKLGPATRLQGFRPVQLASGISLLNPGWQSLLKLVANAIVVLYICLLTLASYQNFKYTASLSSLGLVLVNALFVTLFLLRREAKAISAAPLAWCLSFGGTVLPLLIRPDATALVGLSIMGNALQLGGVVFIGVALLSLHRSFGIVPANRGIRTGGLYRFVRHPLYGGELLFLLGFTVANPSGWNVALWLMELGFQMSRARFEEDFLALDPVYSEYRSRVRYRFIPGLL